MSELPYIDDADDFARELEALAVRREAGKAPVGSIKREALSRSARVEIHSKTEGRCHFCGCDVEVTSFEADHVKNHTSGGSSAAENFLPACRTCNNYRWHYSHEELQWILKIGVWIRHEIVKQSKIGRLLASAFINKEVRRERRRKTPRLPRRRGQDVKS